MHRRSDGTHPPYVDAFGPITEELVLSFCLTDRLRRPPTLVGAFTQVVEGHVAADLGIELIRVRLHRRTEGAGWCGFARALNEYVLGVTSGEDRPNRGRWPFGRLLGGSLNEDEQEELVRAASGDDGAALEFLRIHACVHFRLTGCEPALASGR